jgi:hypothetical protein
MRLETLQLNHDKLALTMKARIEAAKTADAGWTKDDETAHAADLKAMEALEAQITKTKSDQDLLDDLDALTGHPSFGPAVRRATGQMAGKSLGQQFVESQAGAALNAMAKAGWPRAWSSGSVELKATLTEDPASGGGLVVPHRTSSPAHWRRRRSASCSLPARRRRESSHSCARRCSPTRRRRSPRARSSRSRR